jgi:hypothetical protein
MPEIRSAPACSRDWVSVHVFHRGDLDPVLAEAVAPLVEDLSTTGALGSWFFLRYWEGGPHLRVRMRPATLAHTDEVRDALLHRCRRYLDEHPGPPVTVETLHAYGTAAAGWARAERLEGFDQHVRAADSVEIVTYEPERSVYGVDGALVAAETHFAESSALALRIVAAGLSADRRRAVALGLLTISLAVCEPRFERAAARLRSGHVPPPAPGDRRARSLQARQLWAGVNGTGALGGELETWLRSVRTLHRQLVAARADGSFTPTDGRSPLGHLAACSPPESRAVAAAVLRCTHLLFNRLGVHGSAEAQIAGMAAGALTDLDQEGRP